MALRQQAASLVVSVICGPELISALSRLVREKKLPKADYRRLNRDAIAVGPDVRRYLSNHIGHFGLGYFVAGVPSTSGSGRPSYRMCACRRA